MSGTPTLSEVRAFRARHLAEHVGPHYSGWLHFSTTSVGSLAAIAFAVSRVRSPSLGELAAIPIFFLIANFGEYFGHRGPMHHRARGALSILFERHTQQHHHYYTHDVMAADSPRDWQMVLFPPVMLVFFLGVVATPIGLLVGVVFGANLGWLFAATAISYFLTYEWLHWSYHQPDDSLIGRLWFIRRLRQHHQLHHDLRRMTTVNFNITFPIADRLFGTNAKD
jgi:hypothetical protein